MEQAFSSEPVDTFYERLLAQGQRMLHLHFEYLERTHEGYLLCEEWVPARIGNGHVKPLVGFGHGQAVAGLHRSLEFLLTLGDYFQIGIGAQSSGQSGIHALGNIQCLDISIGATIVLRLDKVTTSSSPARRIRASRTGDRDMSKRSASVVSSRSVRAARSKPEFRFAACRRRFSNPCRECV